MGAEIIVVVQAADGSLGNDLFRVTGILEAIGSKIDRSGALIHQDDFDELFATGGSVHEVAFNTRGALAPGALEKVLVAVAPGAEIKSWRELLPVISDMSNMIGAAIWILSAIFFLAAGLGVLNTLLMATHERVPEFGALKALGTSPFRIVCNMAAEALSLALIGTLLGGSVGVAAARLLEIYGIDTTSLAGADVTLGGVTWNPIWRAMLTFEGVLVPVTLMWVVCLIASLFPAAIAARLDPVEAMRRS